MLNLVDIKVITKENDPVLHKLAEYAHNFYKVEIKPIKDGVSIKVKDRYFRAIFYPRIYL